MRMLPSLKLPHPLLLLLGGVGLAAVLTWLLPAGTYQRLIDPDTQASRVIAGSYQTVTATPVGLLDALVAVPRGFVESADIIALILFVGSAFVLLDQTGALRRLVGALVARVRDRRAVIAVISLLFATLGALVNSYEEIIAVIPVLLVLSRRIGCGAITALAMSVGAATVGAAFGPTNPFATGIALRYAELPPMTTVGLRLGILIAAVLVWIGWTIHQASRDDIQPKHDPSDAESGAATPRDLLMLLTVLLPFAVYVYGLLYWDWGFNEMSALFLVAGFAVGLMAGYGLENTTKRLLQGMEPMLGAALVVGVARSISLVLSEGQILDTIVHGLAQPLVGLPGELAAMLMVPIHALLHIPVPSNSGQAILAMPVFAPTADILGISRNVAVLAYQTGGVVMDLVTPTNGALLAMLLTAGVPYGRWVCFAGPGALLMMGVGFAGMMVAMSA